MVMVVDPRFPPLITYRVDTPPMPFPPAIVPPITLLHNNLLVEIMHHLSIGDLINFAICSRQNYGTFLLSRPLILTRHIKRLYGRCAPEILLILHYQRPASPLAPIAELPENFSVTPEDIRNMYRNQRIYRSIELTFDKQQRERRLAYANAGTPFEGEIFLSLGRFLALWLHSIRFQHDTMPAFLERQRLCPRILQSMHDIAVAVLHNGDYELLKESTRKGPGGEGSRGSVPDLFFSAINVMPKYLTKLQHLALNDSIIRMKLVHHLVVSLLAVNPLADWEYINKHPAFKTKMRELMDEFGAGGKEKVLRMVEKYCLELPMIVCVEGAV